MPALELDQMGEVFAEINIHSRKQPPSDKPNFTLTGSDCLRELRQYKVKILPHQRKETAETYPIF